MSNRPETAEGSTGDNMLAATLPDCCCSAGLGCTLRLLAVAAAARAAGDLNSWLPLMGALEEAIAELVVGEGDEIAEASNEFWFCCEFAGLADELIAATIRLSWPSTASSISNSPVDFTLVAHI